MLINNKTENFIIILQAPATKPSTAQSRLQKYPKKCEEPLLYKVS